MKGILLSALTLALTGIIFFISCQKELSCEGCRDGNKPPVAIAGPDQVITLPTDSASLDGTASSDPDGKMSEWLWTKSFGSCFILISIDVYILRNYTLNMHLFTMVQATATNVLSKE